MSEVIRVEICAPERAKTKFEATEVVCPGEDGIFAVRKGHTPLLTTLVPGVLLIHDASGEEHYFAVGGGFAEIESDRVLVLADSCENGQDVDTVRAQDAEQRATERLRTGDAETDLKRAEMALYRAMARIKAAKRTAF